jgi:two-component system phosphate regulon sensor histidine kinase PhoR
MRRQLIWQLYPSYVLLAMACLLLVSLPALHSLRRSHQQQVGHILRAQARLLSSASTTGVQLVALPELQRIASTAHSEGTRITVILTDGTVLVDTDHAAANMENHKDRPEINAALHGQADTAQRFSRTLRQTMVYVTEPILIGKAVVGVVRTSRALAVIDAEAKALSARIGLGTIMALLLATAGAYFVSRIVTRPLHQMKLGADRFASGDLDYRMPKPRSLEMGTLASAMNGMAAQINERLELLARERNEREAVFTSMREGVLAVRDNQHILHMNPAAGKMLGCTPDQARGRLLQEIVRDSVLHGFVARALAEEGILRGEVILRHAADQHLQLRATALLDAEGDRIGALIVLNDITRVRHLEQMRSDFVANVSHELKTPITAIKGFVETLIDGAGDDAVARGRFMDIIHRQTAHLDAIVDDLLVLSRLEHDDKHQHVERVRQPLRPILQAAIEICAPRAEGKAIAIELDVDEALAAEINPHLFEQAIVNLVDNAVKYSGDGSVVSLQAHERGGRLDISIADNGVGIASQHLVRLFERFYRVDKGRSRAMGGTGLGLAIVKHIVIVHDGEVSVESNLGSGTTFTISLPL